LLAAYADRSLYDHGVDVPELPSPSPTARVRSWTAPLWWRPMAALLGHSHVTHNRPKAANSADVSPSTHSLDSWTAVIWHIYPVSSSNVTPDYVVQRDGANVPWAATPPTCLPSVTTLTSHTGALNDNLATALTANSLASAVKFVAVPAILVVSSVHARNSL